MRAHYASPLLFGEGFGLDYTFTDYVLPRVFPSRYLAVPEISPLQHPFIIVGRSQLLSGGAKDQYP